MSGNVGMARRFYVGFQPDHTTMPAWGRVVHIPQQCHAIKPHLSPLTRGENVDLWDLWSSLHLSCVQSGQQEQ